MAAVNALPANCGPRVSSSTVTGFRDFPSDTGLAFRVEGDDAPAGRIDTAMAAKLFSTHPAPDGIDDFLHYVNAPVGRAAQEPISGSL